MVSVKIKRYESTNIKKINAARRAKGYDTLPNDITREEYNNTCPLCEATEVIDGLGTTT